MFSLECLWSIPRVRFQLKVLCKIVLKCVMDILKQQIPSTSYKKLLEANIDSINTIITKNHHALIELTKLTASELQLIIQVALDIKLKNKFRPASAIPPWSRIFTGCDGIDSVTHGGIPVQGINEITGPSGAGKTQICLQLAITVQFPSSVGVRNRGCVYICTEDVFPSKRLHQLAQTFSSRFTGSETIKYEDNIFIKHVADYEQLRRCLYIDLPKLVQNHSIGLVVIDSIAGIFRAENVDVNYTNRSHEFVILATQLNKLTEKYNIAILCTNQVTDNVHTGNIEPCLGLAWSNLVTCRFSLKNLGDGSRRFEVVFAPDLPCTAAQFVINDFGLH